MIQGHDAVPLGKQLQTYERKTMHSFSWQSIKMSANTHPATHHHKQKQPYRQQHHCAT